MSYIAKTQRKNGLLILDSCSLLVVHDFLFGNVIIIGLQVLAPVTSLMTNKTKF